MLRSANSIFDRERCMRERGGRSGEVAGEAGTRTSPCFRLVRRSTTAGSSCRVAAVHRLNPFGLLSTPSYFSFGPLEFFPFSGKSWHVWHAPAAVARCGVCAGAAYIGRETNVQRSCWSLARVAGSSVACPASALACAFHLL